MSYARCVCFLTLCQQTQILDTKQQIVANGGKIVGAEKAQLETEKQVREIGRQFEPKEKTLFEKTHEAIERAQKEDKL